MNYSYEITTNITALSNVTVRDAESLESFCKNLKDWLIRLLGGEEGYDLYESVDSALRYMDAGGELIYDIPRLELFMKIKVTEG